MFDFIEKEINEFNLDVYGIEIKKDNRIIYQKFWNEDKLYPIYSATKTITSAAFGIAKDAGKISEENLLCDFIERKYIEKLSESQKEKFCKLSLERFLTMSVDGFAFRPEGNDWIENALLSNEDFGRKPEFSYSNVSAYLVGVAVENAVGKPLYDYLLENLFEVLEIKNPPYRKCPQGHFYGATGMELTLHDFGKIGQMYLDGGTYGGSRILSKDWVELSVKKHIDNSEGGYGYFVWTAENSFRISGKWGQKCIVYPKENLVITYLSNLKDGGEKMLEISQKAAREAAFF